MDKIDESNENLVEQKEENKDKIISELKEKIKLLTKVDLFTKTQSLTSMLLVLVA